MRVAARAAASTASRVILSRKQNGSSAAEASTHQHQHQRRASRRLILLPLNRRRFVPMAASAAAKVEGAVPAPQASPSFIVIVHAADESTLATVRSLLGSNKELSAGGGATAAVEFSDEKASSSSTLRSSTFDPALYFAALRTRSLGRCLLLSPLLPSTQELVQKASSGAAAASRDGSDGRALPDGAVCVADVQASGRGRGANAWASPPGCLMFSLSADVRVPGTRLPFVQYLVSLALVRAARREVAVVVAAAAPEKSGSGGSGGSEEGTTTAAAESIRIKWPNDLYAGGKKLAGVLCHSSYVSSASSAGGGGSTTNTASCFRLTAGVGINVTNDPPPGAASLAGLLLAEEENAPSSSSSSSLNSPLSRETLLAYTLSELEPLLDALCSPAGFSEELRRAYERAWLHSGQVVEVEEGVAMLSSSGSSSSPTAPRSSSCRVTITGLSPSGFLAAVDSDDGVTRYELHPDGNSLDFFKGLVRKKVGPPPRS